jgi:hypothetical protein
MIKLYMYERYSIELQSILLPIVVHICSVNNNNNNNKKVRNIVVISGSRGNVLASIGKNALGHRTPLQFTLYSMHVDLYQRA